MGICHNLKNGKNANYGKNQKLSKKSISNVVDDKISVWSALNTKRDTSITLPSIYQYVSNVSFKKIFSNASFLPHIYKKLSNEDIDFYKLVRDVKNNYKNKNVPISSINDLKLHLSDMEYSTKNEQLDMRNLKICWGLFEWMHNNISYLKTENNFDIEFFFSKKSASLEDIITMVNMIYLSFSIEFITIPGYIKSINHKKGNDLISYKWVAVKLFNSYRLIDYVSVCMNSPYCQGKLKNFEYLFCTPPQHLIYTHLPKREKNNFLNMENLFVDRKLFDLLPNFRINYFIYQFQLFDYKDGIIKLKPDDKFNLNLNQFRISLCIPETILPNFELKYNEKDSINCFLFSIRSFNEESDISQISKVDYNFIYEDVLFKKYKPENTNFNFNNLKVYDITIRLPKKGKYEMIVSVNSEISFYYLIDANFDNFKEYELDEVMFPIVSDIFTKNGCYIIQPDFYHVKNVMNKEKNVNFIIKIPNATNAALFYDGLDEFVLMTNKTDNIWTFTHEYDKLFTNLVIAACFDDSMEFEVLATYSY